MSCLLGGSQPQLPLCCGVEHLLCPQAKQHALQAQLQEAALQPG
jgi:hypothetical protein